MLLFDNLSSGFSLSTAQLTYSDKQPAVSLVQSNLPSRVQAYAIGAPVSVPTYNTQPTTVQYAVQPSMTPVYALPPHQYTSPTRSPVFTNILPDNPPPPSYDEAVASQPVWTTSG